MYVDSSLPTKKHCDDLYRFLKPTQTSMDSRESNRMEALINKKSLVNFIFFFIFLFRFIEESRIICIL